MPATAAPPPATPSVNPPAPKAGPSIASVTMPMPPSVDSQPQTPAGEDLESRLSKYAKPAEEGLVHKNNTPIITDPPKTETKTPAKEADEPDTTPAEGEDKKAVPTEPATEGKAEAKPVKDGKKVSPWKLVDEHKAARLKAESEAAELRKLIKDEATAKAEAERLTKAEARAKELEEHLRFVDYQNHPEFKEKYQKPYDDAWNRVMKRLAGVGVTDADGTKRPVEVKDILELGQLPADVVIEQAEAKFGKLGSWVAERIEDLKQLSETKSEALDRAKKEGVERAQKQAQEFQTKQKELSETLGKLYKESIAKTESGRYASYLKPKEGDEEFNARLQEGESKADAAFSQDAAEPGITPEEREKRVKAVASARQKIKAWGTVTLTLKRQADEIAALKTKLSQYEASEPKIEGQRQEPNGAPKNEGYSMDMFEQRLRERARPAF